MTKTPLLLVPLMFGVALFGCSDDSPSSTNTLPACPSTNCGKETFRRAVPTSAEVRIGNPTGGKTRAHRTTATNTSTGRFGNIALESFSPALGALDQYIGEINGLIDDVFGDLEACATTQPMVETETTHEWRIQDPEVSTLEDVLRITTSDGVKFNVDYFIVTKGAAPTGMPVVSGDVTNTSDGFADFNLHVDLDVFAAVDPGFHGRGDIVIASMPLAGGESEHWFDLHAVSLGGEAVETSRTTAWSWGEQSGALELVADIDGAETTVYARWDQAGGRYDHHAEFVDPEIGLVDEIATNCWSPSGAEVFNAWALIDRSLSYYGELDGEESACSFGPVEDHPDPNTDFDNLPADGEWELLELLSWCEVSEEC